MQRIEQLNEANTSPRTAELLGKVKAQMSGVPNILKTMAQSAAALEGYLGLAGALARGNLSPKLREQLALTVAGANGCDYCASVHTALGGQHGLETDELRHNLAAQSADPKTGAALAFAARIVATRGSVSDDDLRAVRAAGFSDEEIVEVIAHTALNIFTNYFNHVADTDIDFPIVRAGISAAA